MTEDDKNDVLRWVDDTHDEAEQTERGVEALFAGLTGEHAEDDAHTFHEAAAYTRRNVWDLSAAQYHALKAALGG